MISLQRLHARARRAAKVAAVAAFALVQGMAPLLHAHVAASAGDGQSGIHLPIAVLHASHGHAAASLEVGVVQEESGAITAPTEHRRNEAAPGDPPVVAFATAHPRPAGLRATRPVAAGHATAGRSPHLRPPAQAPPASA